MKLLIHGLISFLVAICLSASATAQLKNDYLSGALLANPDPQFVKAVKLTMSTKQDDRDLGVARLTTLAENPKFTSPALLALSFARGDDNSNAALIKSRQYLEKCVENDPTYSDCQIWLGLYYLHGSGGSVDKKAAATAFQASADTGSSIGQWHLAMAYLKGDGVKKDKKMAFGFINKSARHDYPPALVSYGTMKALGQGTKKNMEHAFQANARAAHLGDTHALYVVAHQYLDGTGVKLDLDMADAAFFLAAEQGYIPAMKIAQKGLMSGSKQQQEELWDATRRNRKILEKVLAAAKLPD